MKSNPCLFFRKSISVLLSCILCFSMCQGNVTFAADLRAGSSVKVDSTLNFEDLVQVASETEKANFIAGKDSDHTKDALWVAGSNVSDSSFKLKVKEGYAYITSYNPSTFDIATAETSDEIAIASRIVPDGHDSTSKTFYFIKDGETSKIFELTINFKLDSTAPTASDFQNSKPYYDNNWVEWGSETESSDEPAEGTEETEEAAYININNLPEFSFSVSDSEIGIDPESVKLTRENGNEIGAYDEESGRFKFTLSGVNGATYDLTKYTFTAKDKAGNTVSVPLTDIMGEGVPTTFIVATPPSITVDTSKQYDEIVNTDISQELRNKIFWFSVQQSDRYRYINVKNDALVNPKYVFIKGDNPEAYGITDLRKRKNQSTEPIQISNPYFQNPSVKERTDYVYAYERVGAEGTVNQSTSLIKLKLDVKVDEFAPVTSPIDLGNESVYGKTEPAADGNQATLIILKGDAVHLTFDLNDPVQGSGLNVDSVNLRDVNGNDVGSFEVEDFNGWDKKCKFNVDFPVGVYDLSSYTLTAKDNVGNEARLTLQDIAGETLSKKLIVMNKPLAEYSFGGISDKHPKYYKKSKVTQEDGVKLAIGEMDDDACRIIWSKNPVVYAHKIKDEVNPENSKEDSINFRDIVSEDVNKMWSYVSVDEGLHEFKQTNDSLFNYQNPNDERQTFIVDDTPPLFNIQNYNASKTLDYAGLTVYPNEDDAKVAWKLTEVGTEPGFWNLAVTIGDTLYAGGYEQFGQTLKPIVEADSEVRPLDTIINTKDMTAYGCDMAGNEVATDFYTSMKNDTKFGEAAPTQLFVDSAAPTIKLTYDKKMSAPGYFNQKTNATLTVTEGSFGILKENEPRKVVAHVTKSGWTRDVRAEEFQEVNGVWQFVYALDYDGTFAFSSDDNFTDIAGKHFEKKLNESVILDTIAPSISVTFDNNECSEPTYFNAQRTATVVVRDKNIDSSLIKTQISNGVLLNWSASEEDCTWTAKVNFANEGECRIVVDATDRATNASKTPFDSDVFTLDFTAPSVSIQRIDDYHAYNDVCAPMIVYSDTNFDSARTTYKITGAVHGESYFMSDRVEASNSLTIDFSDIDHILEYDDVYTIEAEVEDKAGNKATASKRFSVNRFGSNYILSDKTKEILGKQLNYAPEIEVTEINVSGIIDSKTCVMVAKGSDVVSLNSDEYERRRNADAAWDECTYVLPAETFDSDDYYRVLFSSYDTATNIASNSHEYKDVERKNSAPVEFVVDMTNPVSSFLSLENERTRFAPSVNENLFLDDNLNAEGAWLKVDGEVQESYSADDLKASNVKTVNLTAVDRPQSLELVTKDVAGNVSITKLDGVVITNNPFIYWFYTPRLFYGTIAGLLVLAGVISMCVWLHKKNRKYVDMSMSRLIGLNRD